jgi:N-acylneuraminate cytidylyltransferase
VSVLAVVPARGGSKALPGKNLRPLAGRSLLEHALLFAACVPEIERTVVSTDSGEIATAARALGADVPFLRPPELARDETPMWPVLRHALDTLDPDGTRYEAIVLLDPTSPVRDPADLSEALRRLRADSNADGVVGVSAPRYSPIWHAVVEDGGYLKHLVPEVARLGRRQDVPRAWVIDGSLYAWRTSFVRSERESWVNGRNLLQPVRGGWSIDTAEELAELEALAAAGLVRLSPEP